MDPPLIDLTNSLLMKRPVGCVYFFPLGAVSSIVRSDMLRDWTRPLWFKVWQDGVKDMRNALKKDLEERESMI